MRCRPNDDHSAISTLVLRMTPEAKVWVALGEHFAVDRPVRIMAGRATLPQGFVFKNDRARLLAVALRAAFVAARHRQAAGGLEDVSAVGIMALHTVHAALNHRMAIGKFEFRVRL